MMNIYIYICVCVCVCVCVWQIDNLVLGGIQIFVLSGGHFNYKMSFRPTLFSQNYPEDPFGKT